MEAIVTYLVDMIGSFGYIGIFLSMLFQNSIFPFAMEIVLLPAGFLAYKGDMSIYLVIFSAVLGQVMGGVLNYFLAYYLKDKVLKFMPKDKFQKSKEIFNKSFFEWSKQDIIFLAKTAKRYKINSIYNKKEFLKRVNMIPKNLVLAQAAIESGWGKSRFVKEANNIFGQWTFSNFGLVPNDRDKDKKHKLRVFKNLSSSIRAYMKNLNSNRAYKEFREARSVKKDHFDAFEAAKHLKRYSQLKDEYVKILTKTIKTIISHKAKR